MDESESGRHFPPPSGPSQRRGHDPRPVGVNRGVGTPGSTTSLRGSDPDRRDTGSTRRMELSTVSPTRDPRREGSNGDFTVLTKGFTFNTETDSGSYLYMTEDVVPETLVWTQV